MTSMATSKRARTASSDAGGRSASSRNERKRRHSARRAVIGNRHMSMRCLLFRLAPLCAVALAGTSSIGAAQMPPTSSPTGELVARTELRVCADPNSMPFSDEKGEGFENKIAEVLGKDL